MRCSLAFGQLRRGPQCLARGREPLSPTASARAACGLPEGARLGRAPGALASPRAFTQGGQSVIAGVAYRRGILVTYRGSRGGEGAVLRSTNGRRHRVPGATYPAKYSAFGLLRRGLTHTGWPPAWRAHPLKGSYDVVIVGGGVHGLAAAYYLAANHGITDVAVLDKGYIGSGGSGRNTAILRSNYLTPEGVRFYDRSMQLYRTLAADLDYNVMFSRRGHLTLAHNDSSLRTMRWRAEVNQLQGIDSQVIDPAEIKRLVPYLDTSADTRYPILGALYHPPGGIIRHDAVNWGYARAAAAQGVHIHQDTEVTGIDVAAQSDGGGRVRGVRTT